MAKSAVAHSLSLLRTRRKHEKYILWANRQPKSYQESLNKSQLRTYRNRMAGQQKLLDDLNTAIAVLENYSRINENTKKLMNSLTK